jgi:hypothetical protein
LQDDASSSARGQPLGAAINAHSLLLIHSLSLPYKQKTHSNINNNQTQNPKPKKKSTTAAALQSTKSHDFLSRERE